MMPETLFEVCWPDGTQETCYSPSTIIGSHLTANSTYTVNEFVIACRRGLHAASERVRETYGHACSSASSQLAAIERKAETYASGESVQVKTIGGGWRRSA